MTARKLLPQRRAHHSFEFTHDGIAYTCGYALFPNGGLGELFLSCRKVGSAAATGARDAAIVASISLQHGVPLSVVRHALTQSEDGAAAGPLGAALDLIGGDHA